MASAHNKGKKTTRSGSVARKKTGGRANVKNLVSVDESITDEVILLIVLAVCILIYVALFGGLKRLGALISGLFLGLFGIVSYVLPVIVFFALAFYMSNKGRNVAYVKVIAAVCLIIILAALSQMLFDGDYSAVKIRDFYEHCSQNKCGGGFFGGALSYMLMKIIGKAGTYIVLFIFAIAATVLITERSFFNGIKKGSETIYNSAKDSGKKHREVREIRKKEREEYLKEHPEENKSKNRRDNVVSGVTKNITMADNTASNDMVEIEGSNSDYSEIKSEKTDGLKQKNIKNAHNISFQDDYVDDIFPESSLIDAKVKSSELFVAEETCETEIHSKNTYDFDNEFNYEDEKQEYSDDISGTENDLYGSGLSSHSINITGENIRSGVKKDIEKQTEYADSYVRDSKAAGSANNLRKSGVYKFPPVNMLRQAKKSGGSEGVSGLKATAAKLKETLKTFGVTVDITDIAKGPAVTRYEMSLESGTKVSKITGLSDDIKLAMAAKDVRIEAPIPGKSAVGIEIPNKEVLTVSFRELIENKNFKEAESKISFAVGKDLSGDTVVADIGKMPHMLIAGATGSGKSVCINTLIMSIIYKARPDEVKLIMIDPKVVELSVYNGIPHLLIPVVTDPRKAASALNWGVMEMTERYNKFAELNVRDLKGYNKKVSKMDPVDGKKPEILPQIVIIVDELADLMMVSSKEVEEAICRLAQLARAAGIHLVIATQRPSVDVITGLIKANMPSRIAFAVSSGVDSRTILDMNGAERLLGKGDMLFYPQGYSKPVRVQGAFISDEEISDIVEFLKANAGGDNYNDEVVAKVNASGANDNALSADKGSANDSNDEFFIQAARLVIEQDKASIGYFQRKFKIGFNRAARIMDQLYEAGIVAAEEGTKPRKVIMSMEQFEAALSQGEF